MWASEKNIILKFEAKFDQLKSIYGTDRANSSLCETENHYNLWDVMPVEQSTKPLQRLFHTIRVKCHYGWEKGDPFEMNQH